MDLEGIPQNKRFCFDDLVFWHGKADGVPFNEVAGGIDTIVAGPHASAAIPEDVRPHVVFIENPHARWIFDPNRERPRHDDTTWSPLRNLQTFYRRRQLVRNVCSKICRCVTQSSMMRFAFAGADTVRPVTFAGEDVLREPRDESDFADVSDALQRAAELGVRRYDEALCKVVDMVLENRKDAPLCFISLHDTSNCQVRA